MSKRSHVLAAAVWLLSFTSLFGQVGFTLPAYSNTNTGDLLDFPVEVVNFDSVFSVQYVIRWDPQVLEFQSIEHVVNPLNIVDSLCFNLLEVGQGIIRFRWFSNSFRTLADETAIFTIKMKVTGAIGSASSVYFTEIPPVTYFEVVRGPGNQFYFLNTPPQALITNGQVTVGMVSADAPFAPTVDEALWVAPNPFSGHIRATYLNRSAGSVRIFISDVTGKICYESEKYLDLGIHGIEIANTVLRGKGTYFLHIVANGVHEVQPIVYQ